MTTIKLTFVFLLVSSLVFGQKNIGVGVSGAYNFQTKGKGIGFRAKLPVYGRLALVPTAKLYPKFNKIYEGTAGLNLHFNVLDNKSRIGNFRRVDPNKPELYAIAGVFYNRWQNYYLSSNSRAKVNAIFPEVGGGFSAGGNRWKGFLEGKYVPILKEGYAELGVMFYPFKPKQTLKCP